MPTPLQPFHTTTPWTGFGPQDRKRAQALPVCPSPACARARQCIRATAGHFCQRTHLTPAEIRQTRKPTPKIELPTLGSNPTQKKLEAYRIMTDHLVAEIDQQNQRWEKRWRNGELDHLYGPYNPKGVTLVPPERVFVDER
jgi:hypothetical protein